MKNIFCLLFIFITFAFVCFAQDKIQATKDKWTRIETENKELSVSFPPEFLVDAEKKDYNGQRQRIIGFQNGVEMELITFDESEPKKRLQRIDEPVESKKFGSGDGGFTIKRFSSQDDDKHFYETIYLASKKNFYCLSVHSKTSDKPEISRFLYSIKANGKRIFINKDEVNNAAEVTASIAALKTSPEILEALNRKSEKANRKISYQSESFAKAIDETDASARSLIILVPADPSRVSLGARPMNFYFRRERESNGAATIKVQLLANGQVGNITVFSKADRTVLYDFVEATKEIKFIPAQNNGKSIDSEYVFDISLKTF